MADTYCQLYIHYVFAVQNRASLIQPRWKDSLYQYMIGIVENNHHRMYSIDGTSNHLHLLVSMNPKQSPSDLMYHLKRGASLWVNNEHLVSGKFSWQEGFGAFSYGKSQIAQLIHYIQAQEQHHKKQTFQDEYLQFLKLFEVEFDPRYVLKEIE
ncbi:MAG: IS200/IS605 family transposase [Prolixibacteraceae bacterium]|jgi:REP element-mobilizing transposase RayT|nr:IS200/IS605 family transposase [Prolixibacteraceae bacterium]